MRYLQVYLHFGLLAFLMVFAGIGFLIACFRRNKKTPDLFLFWILAGVVGLNYVFILFEAVLTYRYFREIFIVASLFVALSVVYFLNHFSRRLVLVGLLIFLALGIQISIKQLLLYRTTFTNDWGFVDMAEWARQHLPPNAIVLTDPSTFHTISSAIPWIQQPRSLDPMRVNDLLLANPSRIHAALGVICPEYIIIDRQVTQSTLPISLQDRAFRFPKLFEIIYNQETPYSKMTILKVYQNACNSSVEAPAKKLKKQGEETS